MKKKRTLIRAIILIIFIVAIGYVIYSSIYDKKDVISEGDKSPNFQLETLKGNKIMLSDYKGKGVFLNFWATYCPPCKEEMPYMENQYQLYKEKGVEVLAVNIAESNFVAKTFVDAHGLTFPILMDKKRDLIDAYGIGPIPVTFLVDKNGVVVKRITGRMEEKDVGRYMEMIIP